MHFHFWKKSNRDKCHWMLDILLLKTLLHTIPTQRPAHTHQKQFNALHVNTHTVTFKLTGANITSGYLRGLSCPPEWSSEAVNSLWHHPVNAPQHPSLNNLWAASWTGLNGLLQRCTALHSLLVHTSCILACFSSMKEKQGHKVGVA